MTDLPLNNAVPEYRSRNFLVRRLFLKRLELALELAEIKNCEAIRLLDAGCGEGLFLDMLRKNCPGAEITGIDNNPGIGSLRLPGVTLRRADISVAPLPGGSFDRIFCLDVLEHIRELQRAISAIADALKKTGLLIVSAPAENAFHKMGRFMLKGTFSAKTGPAAGEHYHDAESIRKTIETSDFELKSQKALPLPEPFHVMKLFAFARKTAP